MQERALFVDGQFVRPCSQNDGQQQRRDAGSNTERGFPKAVQQPWHGNSVPVRVKDSHYQALKSRPKAEWVIVLGLLDPIPAAVLNVHGAFLQHGQIH